MRFGRDNGGRDGKGTVEKKGMSKERHRKPGIIHTEGITWERDEWKNGDENIPKRKDNLKAIPRLRN